MYSNAITNDKKDGVKILSDEYKQYTTGIAVNFTKELYSPKSRTYMHIVLVYNLQQLFSSRGSFSIVLIYVYC
jgi:hypothetical protein